MSVMLIVVSVSWVFNYVQSHQIVHIKYAQFFVYQIYLNKAGGKIEKKMYEQIVDKKFHKKIGKWLMKILNLHQ